MKAQNHARGSANRSAAVEKLIRDSCHTETIVEYTWTGSERRSARPGRNPDTCCRRPHPAQLPLGLVERPGKETQLTNGVLYVDQELLRLVFRSPYMQALSSTVIRRVSIPKANQKVRPLSNTTIQDRVVQKAAGSVLNAEFEQDFLDCSIGFRANRSPHAIGRG